GAVRSAARSPLSPSLDRPPVLDADSHGHVVGVLEVAAERHAVGNAREAYTERAQPLGEVVGGRVALRVRIGREHDLLDAAAPHARLELGHAQLARADAVDRRERAAEHVVAAVEAAALLDRREIRGLLHHTHDRGVAALVAADGAGRLARDVEADL